jgi:hypothetical protein
MLIIGMSWVKQILFLIKLPRVESSVRPDLILPSPGDRCDLDRTVQLAGGRRLGLDVNSLAPNSVN